MFDALFPSHWSDIEKLMWLKILKGGSAVWDTISGNPVSFTAKAAPLRQLKVAFSPVQDLNGYDSPWPAGGGKNKLSLPVATYEKNGVTIKVNADGSVNISGMATINVIQSIGTFETGAADYLINGGPKPYANTFALVGIAGSSWYTVNSDDGRALPQNSTVDITIYVVNGTDTGNVTIYPMIRPASVSDASFAPYSNECPISGWSSLTVEQRGVNLWDGEWELGTIDGTTGAEGESTSYWRAKGYIPVTPMTDYYVACPSVGSVALRTRFYDADKNYLGYKDGNGSSFPPTNYTLKTPANCYYMRINPTVSNIPTGTKLSINYPATDHDYHAYNPSSRSISISLGSTVYSGTVDVVTGVVTVTMASVDLGTLTWTKGGTSGARWRFSAPTPTPAPKVPAVSAVANALCSVYRAVTANQTWTGAAKGIAFNIDGKILIADEDYADATALTTALTGQTLVYEIAEPFTIQLTPQEVQSLAGDNTMWSNANQPITVTYRSN